MARETFNRDRVQDDFKMLRGKAKMSPFVVLSAMRNGGQGTTTLYVRGAFEGGKVTMHAP
jgi:hypothetical protein